MKGFYLPPEDMNKIKANRQLFNGRNFNIQYVWFILIWSKNRYTIKQMFCDKREENGPGLYLRLHYENLIFLFLNQNICCGYSKEPSQLGGSFKHPKPYVKIDG